MEDDLFLGVPDPRAELLRRSALFGGLPEQVRLRLLHTAIRNDLRGAEPKPAEPHRLVAALRRTMAGTGVNFTSTVMDLVTPAIATSAVLEREAGLLAEASSKQDVDAWWDRLTTLPVRVRPEATDPWTRTLVVSAVLGLSGHVPVLGFAFGRWRLPTHVGPQGWFALLELATCYLYRLVPTATRSGSAEYGRGAYCLVKRRGTVAVKLPLNLAAADFLLRQEALLLRKAGAVDASRHLPRLVAFDETGPSLRREFIPGPTGHEVLCADGPDPAQIEELRHAYLALTRWLSTIDQALDLHPGNFVWHERESRWVLVDVGPVPHIGSDYYDLESFDTYSRDVWLMRLSRMRQEPIRSVDWSADE
jgi:hypothetical protein